MAVSAANNRSVARRVTLLAIALVALVLVLVGLAISVLTERSTRAQVVRSVGDTAQSVAQSLDAADATNRELVQLTIKGFQRNFEATMQLDEGTGELRSYGHGQRGLQLGGQVRLRNRWHRLRARAQGQ